MCIRDSFKDKSDRELTLRPEITAPVARLYLNELQKTASKPIKLDYYGSCFRYERPQKGRFRQFWQFGCELIGAKSPQGEAEHIAITSASPCGALAPINSQPNCQNCLNLPFCGLSYLKPLP